MPRGYTQRCEHGVGRSNCPACRNAYERELRARNPAFAERQQENAREWVGKNKERKRAGDKAFAERDRARHYGLSLDAYRSIIARGCELCGRQGSRLCIDHDHQTGAVRGCLCVTCNVGLGWLEKLDWSKRAYEYLRVSKSRQAG